MRYRRVSIMFLKTAKTHTRLLSTALLGLVLAGFSAKNIFASDRSSFPPHFWAKVFFVPFLSLEWIRRELGRRTTDWDISLHSPAFPTEKNTPARSLSLSLTHTHTRRKGQTFPWKKGEGGPTPLDSASSLNPRGGEEIYIAIFFVPELIFPNKKHKNRGFVLTGSIWGLFCSRTPILNVKNFGKRKYVTVIANAASPASPVHCANTLI